MNSKRIVHRVLAPFFITTCLLTAPSSAQDNDLTQSGVWEAAEMDWPHWRGPEINGISREKNLVSRWRPQIKDQDGKITDEGENVLWTNEEAAGRCTPIVMNGKLYTIVRDKPGTPQEGEKVLCLDAVTGNKLWENRFNVYLSDVPDTRVGWSSVFGDPQTGNVFALGVCGYFQCLDGVTGKTRWSHSMHEEYGLLSTYGGRTNFPIVHGDLVIISAIVIGWGDMAKPAHRFIAFDKRNGQPVWYEGTRILPFDTTYSAPVLTVINGQTLLVFGSGDGALHAFQPQTGKEVWKYQVSSKRGLNITPVIANGLVISGQSEENVGDNTMGTLFALDVRKATAAGGEASALWRHNQWYVGKSSPIVVDGRIYAIEDKGTFLVVDAKTGELIFKKALRGPMFASPLYADGKIFVCTTNGIWWTFEPSKTGVNELYRARLRGVELYASPIVSHGKMYLTTTTALYCIGKKDQIPKTDPRPEVPKETPVEKDTKPAHVQLVPVESLLRPGQKQQFQVRLYNANGQYLETVDSQKVKFSIEGAGSIDAGGKYTTPKDGPSAVSVTASVGELSKRARIRVVPDLPWNIDFNNGEIPITWIGARYRHVPLDFDLFKKLEGESLITSRVYTLLMTDFSNGQPGGQAGTAKYNQQSPRRTLDSFLSFLEKLEEISTLDQAKALVDPALKRLEAEQVIAKWDWQENEAVGIELVVQKGPRKIDGNGVMTKITTIPKGQRSQGWMGHTDFRNYTIQADVQAGKREFEIMQDGKPVVQVKMPDIGISAQRYAFVMKGASQELQIRTWHPQLRMAGTVPFKWAPDIWYTMKLKASIEGGKAVLRGKVWARDDKEPQEWMIEAVDETPNLLGSPGLFGDASQAEIFYDNIQVRNN